MLFNRKWAACDSSCSTQLVILTSSTRTHLLALVKVKLIHLDNSYAVSFSHHSICFYNQEYRKLLDEFIFCKILVRISITLKFHCTRLQRQECYQCLN